MLEQCGARRHAAAAEQELRRLGLRVHRRSPRGRPDGGGGGFIDRTGARDRPVGGRPADQPRDRDRAVSQRQDRRDPYAQHLPQARRQLPGRGRSHHRTRSSRDSNTLNQGVRSQIRVPTRCRAARVRSRLPDRMHDQPITVDTAAFGDQTHEWPLADGRTLGYGLYGASDGPLVVVSMGRLTRPHPRDVVARSATRDQAARADRLGFGSSSPAGERSIAAISGDLLALVDHLGSRRFGLVAQSGGTPYAPAVAASAGDRVTGLAFIGGLAPSTYPMLYVTSHGRSDWRSVLARRDRGRGACS